jgi:cytochrome P450
MVTRRSAEDFNYQGLDIKKGTTVHLFSQAAGTDPTVFENPGSISRPNARRTSVLAQALTTASVTSLLAAT